MRKYVFFYFLLFVFVPTTIWLAISENNNQDNGSLQDHPSKTKEMVYQGNEILVSNSETISNNNREIVFSSDKKLKLLQLNKKIIKLEGSFTQENMTKLKKLRQFLDEVNGDYESLDSNMVTALSSALIVCDRQPRTKQDFEEYENEHYLNSEDNKGKKKLYNMCLGVTKEEISMAYSLVERAAIAGIPDAIIDYSNFEEIPGLKNSGAFFFDEETLENRQILQKHNETSVSMLEKMIDEGNINAVHSLRMINSSGLIQPINDKKALTYLLVIAAVEENKLLLKLADENIKTTAQQLYEADIIEARKEAMKIIEAWEELEFLYK